jgi:hypothetical protein
VGYVAVEVSAVPLGGSPPYRYELLLEAEELGELLGYLPERAIPAVVDRWLAHGDPEAIGAVVGRIVTHLARAKGLPGGKAGDRRSTPRGRQKNPQRTLTEQRRWVLLALP